MKNSIYTFLLLFVAQFSIANASICPDPPMNDDPCVTSNFPPIDLTTTVSHIGTTCCATPDFENLGCSNATAASVWYTFMPSADPDADGYTINLEPTGDGIEGPVSIEIYAGTADQACGQGFTETIAYSCVETLQSFKIGNCFAADEILFIKISTNEAVEECGEFQISISPEINMSADECADIEGQSQLFPITNEEFTLDYYCASGNMDFTCPESSDLTGCTEFTEMPTVWFQIIVDDNASQMFTKVETNGSWKPVWSIFSGADCSNLDLVTAEGAVPCSNDDSTPGLHQSPILEGVTSYWVMISVDPENLPSEGIEEGAFELCVSTVIDAIVCIGDLEGGGCEDESLVIEVTERQLDGFSLDGPFAQGEEVTINISFYYDATMTGNDWFSGIVPKFGAGWDLESFDFDSNAPMANGQLGEWFEEGSVLAPIIQENVSTLCTYRDEDGVLQLCNYLCEPCSECEQQGMQEGDPLPSGYFWVTPGGSPGCENDGSPGEGYGIATSTAQIDWTFSIRVKTFDNLDDCTQKNDLNISFQTFSDGVAGCWEDPEGECLFDRSMVGPLWTASCLTPIEVIGFDQVICNGEDTDILLQTADGSTGNIIVEVEDNPNVIGEMNHIFPGGLGTIQDNLTNTSNEIQVVVYSAYSVSTSQSSIEVINDIEVTVYPQLIASFPPAYVCEGRCTDISPDVSGGAGAPYTYQWGSGELTNTINVCPTIVTSYFVTVVDAIGCSAVSEVQVDVKPPVELLLPESIDVIVDESFDPFDPDYVVCNDFIGGAPPFSISWTFSPAGLVGMASGFAGECYAINEAASLPMNGNNGEYTLTASATDFFGCTNETSMIVNIVVDSTVNVLEALLDEINISPNPSNDVFNIDLGSFEKMDYIVRDMVGSLVEKGSITPDNATVRLGDEPNGIYFIVLSNSELRSGVYYKLLKI